MFHVPAHKSGTAGQVPGRAPNPPADFTFYDGGSIFILTAESPEASAWADEHLPADAQHWSHGTAIEARYFRDIYFALTSEGFSVRGR